MGQYLDKFKDTIGTRQTEQILKLLNNKRNTGQIRSVQEFTDRLRTLMQELTSTTLQPTLKLFLASENDYTDSETYNYMLDRVEDDLLAAFEEANNIDEIQKAHETVIRDILLKNLKAGVDELESKITTYEFLNASGEGYDAANFSTFRESKKGRTLRSASQARVLFVDPVRGDLIPISEDATAELVGERLVLPENTVERYPIKKIRQIFDSTSPQSELIVEPPGTEINNIIDNTVGTYWVQSLLFSEDHEFIKVKVELDLGSVQEINIIEVQPAIREPIILEDIHYIDRNNVITSINFPEQEITSSVGIRIPKVATSKIILTFRHENSVPVQFEYDETTQHLIRQAIAEPPQGYDANIQNISTELNNLISSENIKEAIGILLTDKSVFTGYEFLVGFDNIYVGFADYKSRGIYISSELSLKDMGKIGLTTLESRPYLDSATRTIQFTEDTYDNDSSNELVFVDGTATAGRNFLGSIEYYIVRQEYTLEGVLFRTTTFPILPTSVERIHQERLLLTEKSASTSIRNDLGQTRFFTNTTATEGNIKVYRNGILLEDESNSTVAVDGWRNYPANPPAGPHGAESDRQPNNGNPMRFRIQIINPLPGDIYTVSYNPLKSSTTTFPNGTDWLIHTNTDGLKVVDLIGDLSARVSSNQTIILGKSGVEELIGKEIKIFLAIILRQNTAEASLSPAVEEYTLLAGKKDLTKFEAD